MQVGWVKIGDFRQITHCMSKTSTSQPLSTQFGRKFITSIIHLCLQHVCRDAAGRAGSSAIADTCAMPLILSRMFQSRIFRSRILLSRTPKFICVFRKYYCLTGLRLAIKHDTNVLNFLVLLLRLLVQCSVVTHIKSYVVLRIFVLFFCVFCRPTSTASVQFGIQ